MFEQQIEKETRPRKVIVLVRHPAQEFKLKPPYKLARPDEDTGAHLPISREGLGQIGELSEYLSQKFPWDVKDLEYAIYSSPLKRAKRAAEIIKANIDFKIADGKQIPIPANNQRKILECFSEVAFAFDSATDLRIVEEAKKRNADIMETWLDIEGSKLLPRFQAKVDDIRRGFAFLEQQPTKVDLVMSHGLTIATAAWLIDNPEKMKNENYKITLADIKEILGYDKKIGHTSITEFKVYDDGLKVGKVGATPHLKNK
jgi:broad specificity phosphatase PhoE